MAKYRYIYKDLWEDMSEGFTPEDKLFYVYLMTNASTTQIGVYKIRKKLIVVELGYTLETIESLLSRFEEHHKLIKFNEKTREIALKEWGKYNLNKGGKPIEDCLKAELPVVEDKSLLLYVLDQIKNERIRQIFIEEIQKYGLVSNISKINDDTYHDTSYDTSTIRGQNENENENKKEKEKEYIYSQPEDSEKREDSLDKVNELDASSERALDDTGETMPKKLKDTNIVDMYNNICKSMPKVSHITQKRKDMLKSRFKTFKDIKTFQELFSRAEASDFLSGRNGKWTACNFDWLIHEENMVKVLEGTYKNDDNKKNNNNYKKTGFNDYEQRSYDYAALEANILAKSSQDSAMAVANINLDDGYNALQNKILGRNGKETIDY